MPKTVSITIEDLDYQDTLDAFAKAYGYLATLQSIDKETDELVTIPNPQTPEDFFTSRVDSFVNDVRRSFLVTRDTDAARAASLAVEEEKAKNRPGGKKVVVK